MTPGEQKPMLIYIYIIKDIYIYIHSYFTNYSFLKIWDPFVQDCLTKLPFGVPTSLGITTTTSSVSIANNNTWLVRKVSAEKPNKNILMPY